MTRGPIVLIAFAALMAVQAVLTFAFDADLITHLLLAGVATASLVVGLAALAWRPPRAPATDLSPSTAALALGIAMVVVGAEAGPWLILIGAGVVAAAIGGLVREWRMRA